MHLLLLLRGHAYAVSLHCLSASLLYISQSGFRGDKWEAACGAGVPSVAEAEAEVAAAERTAAAAALHAAQLAASAGLDYAAPAGVPLDLSGIEKARAPAT